MAFQVGDLMRLQVTFTDADSELNVDPTTIVWDIMLPDGTTQVTFTYPADAETTRSALGIFYAEYEVTIQGVHTWRAKGTVGVISAMQDREFPVEKTIFS